MRVIIQRVSEASVLVNKQTIGQIGVGFVILLGIEENDTSEDAIWLAKKIVNMRLFRDENQLMNKCLGDINGQILLISQFTLFAQTSKGNRPGFSRAAKPTKAIPLYELMVLTLEQLIGMNIQTGKFGADMQVSLINDGPVTIIMDTKDRDNF